MKVLILILVLQVFVLQEIQAQYISSGDNLQQKTITAIQNLAQILREVEDTLASTRNPSPAPGPGDGSELDVQERAGNLTEVLKELVEAVQNNTLSLNEANHKADDREEEEEMCEPPFSKHGSECFYVNKYRQVSWSEARKFCQSLQADLAQPRSVKKLRAMLLDKFPEDTYRFFWLGASEVSTDGNWMWLSKSPLSTREWARGQPNGGNENCVVLSRDEYPALHDSPCYNHATFICQKAMGIKEREEREVNPM
ncbi:lithostathine-like [Homarus americanus]|nr:lithostathine-like [Homarus americanus]